METNAFREKYLFWDNRNHFLSLLSSSLADVPGRTVCGFQLRFSSFGLSFSPKIKRTIFAVSMAVPDYISGVRSCFVIN